MVLRVCLASIHPRLLSGQIESLVALERELNALGHRARLVTAFAPELLHRDDRWRLERRDGELLAGKVHRIARVVVQVCRAAVGADLIHLNLPTPAFAALGDLVQALVRVPVVVGYEAHLPDWPQLVRDGALRRAPGFYLPRLLVNNGLVARCSVHQAAAYVVSSELQRRELEALGHPADRIAVLPNLIDRAKLHPLPRAAARAALGLPDRRLVGYAGHFHDVKGVPCLIEAVGLLRRTQPDVHLVLAWSGIGDPGPVHHAVRRLGLASCITWLGRVPLAAVVSSCDVFALPYRTTVGQAAFPALVLEAMALGIPLVTSDLSLIREVVEPDRTALLAPPGDAQALAACLARLLASPDLCAAMVAAQRRHMACSFHPQHLAAEYVELYHHVLARQTPVLQPATYRRVIRSAAFWRR
jgi:glycosyltransferase involved in cell wall biosynthesis